MKLNHGLIYFTLLLACPVFVQSDKGRLWQGRWGQAVLVKLLSTGLGPGSPADPPMPTYKMTEDDAQAVVEYLKSLK